MRRLARIVFVLCSCTTGCHREDTAGPERWPRTIEARVAGVEWSACTKKPLNGDRAVPDAQCGAVAPVATTPCYFDAPTRYAAVTMLMTQPNCIDDAVTALENVAKAEPDALSDLAAAYYTRAQRQDRASDVFLAYDAAARARPSAEALFNLALLQEALGIDDEALATWKRLMAIDDTDWRRDAETAVTRLASDVTRPKIWEDGKDRLHAALASGDEREAREWIRRFPRSAFIDFDALARAGRFPHLAQYARLLSERLGGDRYPLDVAAGAKEALAIEAQRREAISIGATDRARGLAMLETLEPEAARRGYRYVAALIRSSRGYLSWTDGESIAAIHAYELANRHYAAIDDHEGLADSLSVVGGIVREMGQLELAASSALRAVRAASRGTSLWTWHKVSGEVARVGLELGTLRLALKTQSRVVDEVRRITPARGIHMPIALRTRAEIELAANDPIAAQRDLREAARLGTSETLAFRTRMLTARLAEVEGQNLLRTDAKAAGAAFTRALDALKPGEYPTFRAKVLTQRAEANRRMNGAEGERRDLAEAIAVLQREEKRNLERRRAGEREELWSAYFTRPHDAYRQLIAHLMERDPKQAFRLAERARGYEVVDLVRALPFTPPAFLALTKDGEPIGLEELQRELPQGTFLLQYTVTDRRVFAWIVSRDAFVPIELVDERARVAQRSRALQKAGRENDEAEFANASMGVYDQLFKEPFHAILRLNGGKPPERLVIVPDDVMHGLPFAALLSPDSRRYLIEEMPIEVAPSATLYVFSLLRSRALATTPESALLIADPAYETTLTAAAGLGRLEGARNEVTRIAPHYASVKVLQDRDATASALFRFARNKDVVHFAGHSIVYAQQPWSSTLLFAPEGKDHGVLQAMDLVGRQLPRTRLVVLASCSSAGGAPVGAEGVAPLVRPLIATGVPAVVGTLWNVSDTTIPDLSVSFHDDFRRNGDPAAALRNAQLAQIRSRKSVKVWAPFQVVGH